MKDFFFFFFLTLDYLEIKLTVVNEIFQIFLFFLSSLRVICGILSRFPGLQVANEFQRKLLVRLISIQQSDI